MAENFEIRDLEKAITVALKPAGFRKVGRIWVRGHGNVLTLFHLQRSPWSAQFYINAGAYLAGIDSVELPKSGVPPPWDWQLSTRLEHLSPERKKLLEALNLEEPFMERGVYVASQVLDYGVPLLDQISTEDNIRAFVPIAPNFVPVPLRLKEALGIPSR